MTERLDDGFSTYISFSEAPSLGGTKFWEKEVTPPGMSAGGANDTTTMRNTRFRTKAPKKLISMDDMDIMIAYDPAIYDDLVLMLGINQAITITYSDESTLTFWGWIDEVKPSAIVEGEQPTASLTIICSNENASKVETAPVYADGSSA